MNEKKLEQLFRSDLSLGTDAFRDTLLERCLEVIRSDEGYPLSESELDLLAAAGDPFCPPFTHDKGESPR